MTHIRKEINEFFAKHNLEDEDKTKEDVMTVVESYAKADRRISKSIEKFLKEYFNEEPKKPNRTMTRPAESAVDMSIDGNNNSDGDKENVEPQEDIPKRRGLRRVTKAVAPDYKKC